MLQKIRKLHLNNDFDKVFKTGRSTYGRFLGVKSLQNKLNFSRFGVILGLKIEKSAVKRHFLKRRVFSIISKMDKELFFSGDYVIIALAEIKKASSLELEQELRKLLLKK